MIHVFGYFFHIDLTKILEKSKNDPLKVKMDQSCYWKNEYTYKDWIMYSSRKTVYKIKKMNIIFKPINPLLFLKCKIIRYKSLEIFKDILTCIFICRDINTIYI